MSNEQVLEELQSVFQEAFDLDDVDLSMDTSPDDIEEWDSLSQIELLLAIEERFSIKFSLEDASSIHSVGNIVDAVVAKMA